MNKTKLKIEIEKELSHGMLVIPSYCTFIVINPKTMERRYLDYEGEILIYKKIANDKISFM